MAFQKFNSFPPEIHSMILSSCSPNDRTCLSLTCKYLYKINPKTKHISLSNQDVLIQHCSTPFILYGSMSQYDHRQDCHDANFTEATNGDGQSGSLRLKFSRYCRTDPRILHCQCFIGRTRLHQRLRTWVPRGLNYCGQCNMFTRRKRSHNGRCFHGHPKPRRQEPKYWTHRSRRGAFGQEMWKKWFRNSQMNAFERKLGVRRDRAGRQRYAMRTLEPKRVDTRKIRDS